MDTNEAFEIVLELADQNALCVDLYEEDNPMRDEALKQQRAISIVQTFVDVWQRLLELHLEE
jgi:hypothetical protein